MKTVLKILAVVGLAVLWFMWWNTSEVYSWRQKTILQVETPTGPRTGSSVIEGRVSWFRGLNKMMSSNALSAREIGEAAFVEVAPGRYLFALSGEVSLDRAHQIFRSDEKETFETFNKRASDIRGTREVPPALYPRLVMFKDVNDPASVQLVDPSNLAATFGPGFALKGIKLEMTDEPVTRGGIEKVLSWLGPYPEPGLCPPTGSTGPVPDCRKIHEGDLIRR
jgi:hypothetical protein